MQEAGDIMKTFLGQSSPEHQEVFEYLQGEKRWLSSQEVEAYTFLAKEFDASGQYSTETRFVDEFDRYEIPMQNSRVLSLEPVFRTSSYEVRVISRSPF